MNTVHILGQYRGSLGPARFGRFFSDVEFELIQRAGLPKGWIAWHIREDEVRKWKAMQMIPVMVQPGTNKPIDPIRELADCICDLEVAVRLQLAEQYMTEGHTAQAA